MIEYGKAYKNIFTYIRTLEKIAGKDKSPLITESMALIYDLVKKSEPLATIGATVDEKGKATANCPRCRKTTRAGLKICPECGQRLKWEL